jgi:hypothetical protein
MLQLQPLDVNVPIFRRLQADQSPIILVNIFHVAEPDIPSLLKAWADDATWMKSSRALFLRSSIRASPAATC